MEYGIYLDARQQKQLADYMHMMIEKNKVMDLTNVPSDQIPLRHFVDSLLPVKLGYIPREGCLADVGTGAGLPGMPVAIMCPQLKVTLMDAQEKRCAFLRDVKEQLKLDNVEVMHIRAEEAGRRTGLREQFDICTARAVAAMNVLIEYMVPLLKVGGHALCWKGPGITEEMPAARYAAGCLNSVMQEPVRMPLEGMEHYLVQVSKTDRTPKNYPRKNGMPGKNPLCPDI